MRKKNIKRGILVLTITVLGACGEQENVRNVSIDTQLLVQSFERDTLENYIDDIVHDVKNGQYEDAMNELALLSATRKLTRKQEHAIDMMIKKLRYEMEEEMFQNEALKGESHE